LLYKPEGIGPVENFARMLHVQSPHHGSGPIIQACLI
jgi:hypothetical protein